MCVYSMVVDHYRDKWDPVQPAVTFPYTPIVGPTQVEVAEFRKLLERARKYDKDHNEPDCEFKAKKDAIKSLAAYWGLDISFIDEES